MISILAPAVSWVTTGVTAAMCGCLRRMSPTLMGTGAPVRPVMNDEPGGFTIMSAPMPAWRGLLSFRIPGERPRFSRTGVPATATATMLMADRSGRYTRLATIILFIRTESSFFVDGLGPGFRPGFDGGGILPLLVEVDHRHPRGLGQHELIVAERLIGGQFRDTEGDADFLDV